MEGALDAPACLLHSSWNQTGLADSHRLAQSDDCFLNGMYRIGMREEFRTFSPRAGKGEREAYQTWI